MKHYRFFDQIMALFVTVLLISTVLSSAKIIDFGFAILGLAFLFDAGTLVFPISYIFGDILTEVYGYQRSRRVIWTGFGAVALFGFFIWLAGELPAEASWSEGVGDGAYQAILGGIPALLVASLAAYWLGEFSNSYVLAKMKMATGGRYLPVRTIGSTLVAQAVDTLVFFILATALGVFEPAIFWSLVVSNYLFKLGIEVLLTPLTLALVSALKQAEGEDYYDWATNFNPFHF
jgi:hypothetical protein